MVKKPPADKVKVVTIPPIHIGQMKVTVIGTSPLIIHCFSEKSKKDIEEGHEKKPKPPRKARDPNAEYLASMYTLPNKPGKQYIKTMAFKCAIADVTASFLKGCGINKTTVQGAVYINDDFAEIKGSKPRMVTHIVRIGKFPNQTATPRYRPQFDAWEVTLTVRYDKDILTPELILNLFDRAGWHIGVAELRPQKGGHSNGMFEIKRA